MAYSPDDPQFTIPDNYKIYNYSKSTESQLLSYTKIGICTDTTSSTSATSGTVKKVSNSAKNISTTISEYLTSKLLTEMSSVILPYPDSIRVDNNLNWTDFNLDSEIYKSFISGAGSIAEKIPGLGKIFGSEVTKIGAKILSAVAKPAMYGLRTSLNPGIVEFFTGVGLSEFEMAFNFVPMSQDESTSIKQAYNELKYAALPELSEGNFFFIWPSLFNLEIYLNHTNICTRKKLAITNISLDMNPNSNPSAHTDGTPTNLKLNIRFKETDIVTKNSKDLQQTFGS